MTIDNRWVGDDRTENGDLAGGCQEAANPSTRAGTTHFGLLPILAGLIQHLCPKFEFHDKRRPKLALLDDHGSQGSRAPNSCSSTMSNFVSLSRRSSGNLIGIPRLMHCW